MGIYPANGIPLCKPDYVTELVVPTPQISKRSPERLSARTWFSGKVFRGLRNRNFNFCKSQMQLYLSLVRANITLCNVPFNMLQMSPYILWLIIINHKKGAHCCTFPKFSLFELYSFHAECGMLWKKAIGGATLVGHKYGVNSDRVTFKNVHIPPPHQNVDIIKWSF